MHRIKKLLIFVKEILIEIISMDNTTIKTKLKSQIIDLKQDILNKENILTSYEQDKVSRYKEFFVEESADFYRFSINETFDKFNLKVPRNKYRTIEKAFIRILVFLKEDLDRKTKVRTEVSIF